MRSENRIHNIESNRRNLPVDNEQSLENLARFHQNKEKAQFRDGHLFVLLLGPSSVGKSTLISALNEITDDRFVYVNPYTTRDARINDDKIAVADEEFDRLEQAGIFIQVNHLYGARYGPPLANIHTALTAGKIPVLDFPLDKIGELERPEYDLLNIYIFPETVKSWTDRLDSLNRNNTQLRLDAGLNEMEKLSRAYQPHPGIHFSIVNKAHQEAEGAQQITSFIDEVRRKK